MTPHIKAALLGSISLLAITTMAWADTESPIEEITVTADKRTEVVKNVPLAITVIGEKELERTVARSFEDYVSTVPGLTLTASDPAHTTLILRGINAGGDGSTVGTYLDETPYGSSSALANGTDTAPNIDTFDIQRIEVLRGPQGTLYGASTMGGLLKFVTNAPDPSGFDDKLEVGGTDLDHGADGWSARGMVNIPLSDDLAVRIVGFDQHTGGYIDDPGRGTKNLNGTISSGGRASVLYKPTDKLSIRVSADVQKLDSGNDSYEDVILTGDTFHARYGDYEQQRTINAPTGVRYYVYNTTIDWDLDWATLTSSTSYDALHDHIFTDATGVYGVDIAATLAQKKVTQELRLTSPDNGNPFEWLVGFYYTHEIGGLQQNLVVTPHSTPLGSLSLDSRFVETAGFANVTYHFTPSFDVSLGGRYAHNSQAEDEFGLASAVGGSSGDVFTWSAAASYHLDDETSLYARAAKGYRPGGPNALPPGPPPAGVPTTFGADSLINYEVGVKTDLLDDRLSLDADLFLINWDNIQLLTVVNGYGVNNNGGTARSEGAELSAEWRPVDPLTISLSGAYTDAYLTGPTSPYLGGNEGNALPWAPKWSSNLSADYEFDSIGGFSPYVGGTWRYVDTRKTDFSPGVVNQYVAPSYSQLDARVGVEWKSWSLELYGKNLTNAKGVTAFEASGSSAASANSAAAALIAPREIGLELTGKL